MKCRVYKTFMLLVTLVLSVLSCIKEQDEDCLSNIRIYFDFVGKANRTNIEAGIDPSDINNIYLYVFDKNDLYIGCYRDEAPAVETSYYMQIDDLRSGIYRFIAWGGLNDDYGITPEAVKGQTTFEEMELQLNSIVDKKLSKKLQPLFYASHPEEWCKVMFNQDIHLKLRQNTYKINVSVISRNLNARPYELLITDDNGRYSFANKLLPQEQFSYVSDFTYDGTEQMSSQTTVMLLNESRSPTLEISDQATSYSLLKTDLVKLILALEENGTMVDFDNMHEFDILFDFNAESTVTVKINGWVVSVSEIELGRKPGE